MMKFFQGLKAKIASHKIISAIIGVIILTGIGCGGFFAYKQYEYRQTSLYAFEKLKACLNPPQPSELAHLIDFNAISQELAQAIAANFPFFMAGDDQIRKIRNVLQTTILRKFMGKDEPSKQFKEDETEEKNLQKPLVILPDNFVEQLYNNLHLQSNGPDSALISAKIDNPLLGIPLNLVFNFQKTAQGWLVRRLLNAREITAQVNEAMLKRHQRLREVFLEKNAATLKKMNEIIPVQSCSANAGLLSDGKTLLMVVEIIARNISQIQVNNFNVDTVIIGKDGKPITQRFLNVAKPVKPGEDFNHRWNFELDSQSELAQNIMLGIPLQCQASWQTLGLNNSRVLHIEEVPNPDRACLIDGHNHPEGFCLTPVFLP